MKNIIILMMFVISSCSPLVPLNKTYEILGVTTTRNNIAVRDTDTDISTIITNKNIYNNYRLGLTGFGRGDIVKVKIGEIKKSKLRKLNRQKWK